MAENVNERIEQLREEIARHDYLYYVLNQPEVSDQEYDRLFAELKELENKYPELVTPDSPTQRVSGQPLSQFDSVRHSTPMLSLDNTYNAEELRAFDERVRKAVGGDFSYVVELKIDGLAISLRYENGKFVQGATRGDGVTGDNVTANVRTIKSVPLTLRRKLDVLEVRGEVYMSSRSFEDLNRQRAEVGEPGFANPRNAAAGSLKLLDPRITAKRNLSFLAYSVGDVSGIEFTSQWEMFKELEKLGLPINEYIWRAKNIDEVMEKCLEWQEKRTALPYQIDGMVVKVNEYQLHEKLGVTGRSPKWAISYKFPAERAETVIRSIDIQVGKSGILTPVANLEPVLLAGTTVKRASLHNFDELGRLDAREGDTVLIEKAGEIIPQVISVKKEGRPAGAKKKEIPSQCPVCGSPVKKDENGVYIRCLNPNCLGQLKEKLKYFAGRGQMDIEHLGEKLIEQLVDSGLVNNFADIYKLKKEQLIGLERMAEKSAGKIVDSIEKSKDQPLWRFIAGLGIRHVGGQSAQILTDHFGSLDKLMQASEEDLTAIDGVGPVMAKSIYEYFRDPENRAVVDELRAEGVRAEKTEKKKGNQLTGKTIVVTGSLENFNREEIKDAITKAGGKVSSSVSSKTSFVLVGAEPGSKLDKARELGVKVIDENKFMDMIGASEPEKTKKNSDKSQLFD